jgi:hypothetical protein
MPFVTKIEFNTIGIALLAQFSDGGCARIQRVKTHSVILTELTGYFSKGENAPTL